jgi:hypothetical protein
MIELGVYSDRKISRLQLKLKKNCTIINTTVTGIIYSGKAEREELVVKFNSLWFNTC